MGVMDKFLNAMKLNDEDEDDFFEDDLYDEPIPEKPKKTSSGMREDSFAEENKSYKKPSQKITSIHPTKKPGNGMQVCVIKPVSMEDAREITETLLSNRTVVLNLEGLDVEIAQRIIDYTAGSCYAIHGNLQKISHYIFIITPEVVDISGDFQEILSGSFDVPINNGL